MPPPSEDDDARDVGPPDTPIRIGTPFSRIDRLTRLLHGCTVCILRNRSNTAWPVFRSGARTAGGNIPRKCTRVKTWVFCWMVRLFPKVILSFRLALWVPD